MRIRRAFVGVAAAAALAGIVMLPASGAQAAGAAISANPSSNLHDNDAVAVSVTGLTADAGSQFNIWECHGDATITYAQASQSCMYLAQGTPANGGFSTTVNVHYGSLSGFPVSCDETSSGSCELAAIEYPNGAVTNGAVLATTPISFAAPDVGLTVTPNSGLKDRQGVAVTVNAAVPSTYLASYIFECNTAYAAAHGYPAGCNNLGAIQSGQSLTVAVFDGPTADAKSACDYATNGQCALVVLGQAQDNSLTPIGSSPITFRPPVLGPAAISVSPTKGLHGGSVGTVSVSAAQVRDGFDQVYLDECNVAAVAKYVSGDWEYKACSRLASIKVVNNSFGAQSFRYAEGAVGNTASGVPCDHTHACAVALVGQIDYGNDVVLSNAVPISFRDPNFGTPTLTLSKYRGLVKGDTIRVKVTDVPDLVRALFFRECNVKGGYRDTRCVSIYVKPGDQGAAHVVDDAVAAAGKIKAGVVGTTNSGKKVYCTAKTNGQCVLVAMAYPGYSYLVQSAPIRFAKA